MGDAAIIADLQVIDLADGVVAVTHRAPLLVAHRGDGHGAEPWGMAAEAEVLAAVPPAFGMAVEPLVVGVAALRFGVAVEPVEAGASGLGA